MSDFYNDGSELPQIHPDASINKDILIGELCAKLDTARKVINECTYLQLIEPANQRIKGLCNWALDETHPRTLSEKHPNVG